jgi:hypothetical protein
MQLKYVDAAAAQYDVVSPDDICAYVDNSRIYGTAIITYDFKLYQEIVESGVLNDSYIHNYITYSTGNNYNRIILGGEPSSVLRNYDRIVYLGTPLCDGFIAALSRASGGVRIAVASVEEDDPFCGLTATREALIQSFSVLKRGDHASRDVFDLYERMGRFSEPNLKQFVFAYLVFCELGILEVVSESPFIMRLNKQVKSDVESSEIFKFVRAKTVGA